MAKEPRDKDSKANGGSHTKEEQPQPTTLLLVRHALNDWVGDRLAGWTPDIHLNDKGRGQAEALAQRLADKPLAAVYSSPLERAVETASIIARPHNLEVQIREGVGEVRYGKWTGQSLKELAKEDAWRVVQFYPSGAYFPDGEGIREMQARAVAELDSIAAAHPSETVLVVSHADVIKASLAHYAGLHLDMFQRLVISPASLSVVAFTDMGPRLVCLNDTAHIPPEETPNNQQAVEDS
ncbi:MAG: histidine phosphatase family protein [Anaerolineae bacterium]